MDVLETAGLAGRRTKTLDAAGEGEAILVEVSAADMLETWARARDAVPRTGRWPVLVVDSVPADDWGDAFVDAGLFSRFYFGEEVGRKDVRPSDLLRRAEHLDIDAAIDRLVRREMGPPGWAVEVARDQSLRQCGAAPGLEELTAVVADNGSLAVERHLFDWEDAHGCRPSDHLDLLQPIGPVALALLPAPEPWSTYAYLHSLYGTDHDLLVAAARRWYERYGAEPITSWLTSTTLAVARKPRDVDEAFGLAAEHYALAADGFGKSGIALRWHARALLSIEHWDLFSGP